MQGRCLATRRPTIYGPGPHLSDDLSTPARAPFLRRSAPRLQRASLCRGKMWLRVMVLGRLGRLLPPHHERVLYPAHHPPFTGRGLTRGHIHPGPRFPPIGYAPSAWRPCAPPTAGRRPCAPPGTPYPLLASEHRQYLGTEASTSE